MQYYCEKAKKRILLSIFQRKILLYTGTREEQTTADGKPRPVVKVEEVEVNEKIVYDREGRREVAEDMLPKDRDV